MNASVHPDPPSAPLDQTPQNPSAPGNPSTPLQPLSPPPSNEMSSGESAAPLDALSSSSSSSSSPSSNQSSNQSSSASSSARPVSSSSLNPSSSSSSSSAPNSSGNSAEDQAKELRKDNGGASVDGGIHPMLIPTDEFVVEIFEPKDLKTLGIKIHDFAFPRDDPRFDCDYPEPPEEERESRDLNEIIKVRALFDYTGESENELSFSENDVILITDSVGNGWLSGILGGKVGFVPEGYVERFD